MYYDERQRVNVRMFSHTQRRHIRLAVERARANHYRPIWAQLARRYGVPVYVLLDVVQSARSEPA